MSFLTPKTPKDAFKVPLYRAKSSVCENGANKAINGRLITHVDNISHKYSSHIII